MPETGGITMLDLTPFENMTKLSLTDSERTDITKHISEMLKSFETVKAIDTTGVTPMFTVLDTTNVLREDVQKKSIPREVLLSTAPEQYGGYFSVPKTVQ